MGQVDKVVTRFSEQELADALARAYTVVFGKLPTAEVIKNAFCQNALECGRDGKGMITKCRCFNLGNITLTTAQMNAGVDYWALRCKEQLRDKEGKLTGEWRYFDMRFVALSTLYEGAQYYWRFFASPKRTVALKGMHQGLVEFTAGLSAIWYMTANPAPYLAGMLSIEPVGKVVATAALASPEVEHRDGNIVPLSHMTYEVDDATKEKVLSLVGITLNTMADDIAEEK